jgi:hypothetical protein
MVLLTLPVYPVAHIDELHLSHIRHYLSIRVDAIDTS